MKEILEKADITFGNLECALTGSIITRNVRQNNKKWFCFKVPPKYGQALICAGFDIVSLANNHTMDGGTKGIIETIDTLSKLGIIHVGGGRNFQEAHTLRIFEIENFKIGFLAYTAIGGPPATKNQAGIAKLNENIFNEVATAKEKVDLLVVSLHWGIEGSTKPTDDQKKIARKLVEAGTDLLIGHHPHVLQPIEKYKDKLIVYSLGNFVFDNPRPICCETMILWVEVDKNKNIDHKEILCKIKNAQPSPSEK